jgi:hypothetical protein
MNNKLMRLLLRVKKQIAPSGEEGDDLQKKLLL